MWILEQFGVYIVIALGAIAALFGVRQSGKSAGRKEAEHEHDVQNLDAIRKANENRGKVSRMDDDSQLAEFDRLRVARREKDRR